MTPPNILIIDDDEDLNSLLSCILESEGYRPTTADCGRAMHAELKKGLPDLLVLDLNLPDENGLVLARQVRARSELPIIVLTASHDRDDLMSALKLGVDDFVTKPFDPKELVLRIRNVLSRTASKSGAAKANLDRVTFDGWTLDFKSCQLLNSSGNEEPLTPGEFNVLSALVRAQNRVLSRDNLLDAVCKDDEPPLPRMIDVFISQLRKKLEIDPKKPSLIVTSKGKGYRFAGETAKAD